MASSNLQISESDFDALLGEVDQLVAPILKAEKDKLQKGSADEKSSASPEGSASSASSEGPPADDGSAGGPPSPSAPPDASASAPASPPAGPPGSPPASPSPAPGAPPDASASAQAAAPQLPADPAQLQAMIQSAPPDVLKMIYLASKQALMAGMQQPQAPAAPPDASAGAPSMPPPDASASAGGPPPPVPPMGKTEMKSVPANGGKQAAVVNKSEDPQVAELTKLVKSQSEEIGLLTRAVAVMTQTPLRKAVTGLSTVPKPTEKPAPAALTKSQINDRLKEQIRGGKLAKKEKDNILRYFDNGCVDLSLVKHLLE